MGTYNVCCSLRTSQNDFAQIELFLKGDKQQKEKKIGAQCQVLATTMG